MRRLALCILLIAPMAHAGESRPYGPAVKPEPTQTWMACRLTIAKPDRPLGSLEVIVYTMVTLRNEVTEADVSRTYSAFVEMTYGVRGGVDCASTKTEADAQQYLDYWTTNKAYPQQFTVIETGWTYQAKDD